jgi:putative spermidine/putrescine transport system substrate-binding protein
MAAGAPCRAFAQAEEEPILLFGARGGIRGDAMEAAVSVPFEQASGITVENVTYPDMAKLQAMVETNTLDIDLMTTDSKEIVLLSRRGLLEPIDYSQLPPNLEQDLLPGSILEYGVAELVYGQGLVYNTEHFSAGNHPRSWAEFWDVEKFPGPRMLPNAEQSIGPLEVALIADGVAVEDLYPIDVDRAFAKLDLIKPHIVKWWGSSAEGMNLLTSRNAVLGMMTFGRVVTTKMEQEIPLDIEFSEGFAKFFYWIVPKGAKHPGNAHKYMSHFFDPKVYGAFMNAYPSYGPVLKTASEYIEPKFLDNLITAPKYADDVVLLTDKSDAWWIEQDASGVSNFDKVLERWNEWVAA